MRSASSCGMCLLAVCFLTHARVAGETLSLSVTNANGELILSWPGWAQDAVLEYSTNVQPFASWAAVERVFYETNSAGFRYLLPAQDQNGYFRLRRMGPQVPVLVTYWSLDEASSQGLATDASGANPLNMSNVVWAAGRVGPGCLQFNGLELQAGGSMAWVSNVNYQILPAEGPFSTSLWFCPDAPMPEWQPIFGNDLTGTNGWHVAVSSPGPGTNYLLWAAAGGVSPLSITGQTLLLPGRWHQLTLSYSPNQAFLYLDSRLLAQGSGTLTNPQSPLYVGGGWKSCPSFLGRLDELRVYTNALSREQVSVTGRWHFDENAGSLAADSGILGHPSAVVSPAMWTGGKTNSGLDLSLGQVTIPNNDYSVLPPGGAPFSVSFWMVTHGLPVGRSGLLYCGDLTGQGWQMTLEVDSLLQTWLEVTSTNLGGTLALRAPIALTNGAWNKLDLTYDGGLATLYVNGNKVQSEQGAIRSTQAPLNLGAVPGTANFNGIVDELTVYSREREAAEIGPIALPMWEMALINSATDLLLPGTGPPGKLLTYSLLSAPALGTANYSPGLPILRYQARGQKGQDSFVYTVSDGEFISPPTTAIVSVVEPHWLSPDGGNSPPLDGSSPQKAWPAHNAAALDDIWRTNNYYDCFFYAPGEYQTTGFKWLERSTANPGCKHVGSGAEGPASTTIKLVDTRETWNEGIIFAPLHQLNYCDDFEVRNLVLDCNAQGNPKYVVGEPVRLDIPLTATNYVDSVTLHWSDTSIAGTRYKIGRPLRFSVSTRTLGPNGYATNLQAITSTGQVDVVSIATNTDEILVQLNQRAEGVDFYGLQELQIQGGTVSLPLAAIPTGGTSQLDPGHSVLKAIDGDRGTSWASGPESQVEITLPLAPGTPVSQINFNWNCQTLPNASRLGPAASYVIYARDESTGQLWEVPFVSHGREANGMEAVSFGTADSTNGVATDRLTILLTAREPGVDFYSLREVSLQAGDYPTPLRVPNTWNTLVWDMNRSLLNAFDGDPSTGWACGTQGNVGAADVRGSNMKFINLKVINFGTKAGKECFGLVVLAPDYGPPLRNVLLENCAFLQPATNNSDGLTAVAVAGQGSGRLLNATVRHCTVSGVRPYFTYSHAFAAPLVENCLAEDCEYGVYFEPDPGGYDNIGPVVIRSNQFVNVVLGVSVEFHPAAHFDSLLCSGNEIVLVNAAPEPGFGIRLCDTCLPGTNGILTNLLALNNIIRHPGWALLPSAPDGGLLYSDIQHAIYGNNIVALDKTQALRVRAYPSGIIPGVAPREDCDNPGYFQPGPSSFPPSVNPLLPGYRRAWFNNRDLSGVLLPVRFYQWGADGLAAQQQWPE